MKCRIYSDMDRSKDKIVKEIIEGTYLNYTNGEENNIKYVEIEDFDDILALVLSIRTYYNYHKTDVYPGLVIRLDNHLDVELEIYDDYVE